MDPSPIVNSLVTLLDQTDNEYRSRVEGVEGELLTVARPLDLLVNHEFEPGSELLVSWSCPRGIAVLPVRLVAERTEGVVPVWELTPTRNGWIEQRRRYVRVPANGALALRLRDQEHAVEAIIGSLVDLSEGALRCVVDVTKADEFDDGEVSAHFRFGEHTFDIPGRIVFRRPGARHSPVTQLIIVFDEPVREADLLRRQVFAQQLRTRPPS